MKIIVKKQTKKAIKAALDAAHTAEAREINATAARVAYQHGFEEGVQACADEAEALRKKTAVEFKALREQAAEASKGWWERWFG
jgi:hypothetical protein